jgi:hypothetical protein
MLRLTLLLAILLFGCRSGQTLDEYGPARTPQGALITINTDAGATVSGEVLAVRDDALVLRATSFPEVDRPVIVQIDYSAIRRADFDAYTKLDISSSRWHPSDWWRQRVRLRSRFPHSIAPDVMDGLLRMHDQRSLLTVP